LAFSGTVVTGGSGRGLVVGTGAKTEIGHIAGQLAGREPPTPVQLELRRLSATLGKIAVAIAASVFVLIGVRMGTSGEGLRQSIHAAVALAIAAVPEGLATDVTVALALCVRRKAGDFPRWRRWVPPR
jgi:Ca2+-transporting ATPase